MAINIKDLLTSPESISRMVPRIDFWRTAARSGFSDIFYKVLSGVKPKLDKWFFRLDFESDLSFLRRAMTAKDPAWSNKIITSYTGFFTKAKIKIDTGLGEKYNDYYMTNIDRNGKSADTYKNLIFQELISVGQVWIMVDNESYYSDKGEIQDVRPYIYFIKRENILDYQLNNAKDDFVKYVTYSDELIGISRTIIRRVVIVTNEKWIIYKETGKKKFELEKSFDNELGKIPIIKGNFGEHALPIINTAAKYQLDIFNFQSEVRNTLSVQNINLLGMPESVYENFKKNKQGDKAIITANSIMIWPNNYEGLAPQWIGPPANTLDPHFKYMEWLVKSLISMSNLRQKVTNMAESEKAKAFEWLDTEAILYNGKLITEEILEKTTLLFGNYAGENEIESNVEIDSSFQTEPLTEYLINVLRADTIQLDEISMTEIRKKIRDMLIKLNPKMKEKSNVLIEQIINEFEIGENIPV